MKSEWKRESALGSLPLLHGYAAAQLVVNNRETIWLCLDRGFVEFGRKPIWRSGGAANLSLSIAVIWMMPQATVVFLLLQRRFVCLCAPLPQFYIDYIYQPLSLVVLSFHTDWWIDAPPVILKYTSLCQITGIHTPRMSGGRWARREMPKIEEGSEEGVKDVMG